jgi:hypothetical protein
MPDGRRNNGGARHGAGRKTKAAEKELERLLKKCWPKEKREAAFKILGDRAALGSLEAFKVLAGYAFGKPMQRVLVEDDRDDDKGRTDLSQLTAEELEVLERAGEIVARARRGTGRKGTA